MAQQNLQTIVSIGGRVDNTFGMIGESLIGLGSQIDMISQKIIDFGKESVQEYVNYDDLMREVKAVGEFTDAEIASLDAINSQIAKTTVYSNAQAAEAEVLMGQYGMLIPEIKEMLPSTLELAMAGNISIANSVDYLYSTLKSLGLGMEYADELTDQMAKTAAIGATDIDTLGDSLTRLGSGAQMFKGGSVEILAILSAMSQFGEDQRGSIAGTWIRNFMLSLTAPMGELDDIIDAMEQLGATQDEIDEYVGGKSSGIAAQAVDSLMEAGLRIYDESGNLLPAIDIIKSLRDAVRGSGDYADDLNELSAAYNAAGGDVEAFLASTDGLTDNALYNIFRRIFGRRGVTTALNLISISDAEWEDTIGEIMNSEGFAESMAETMQGGLGGALRELEATFTEFETTIGGILAPSVEGVAGWLKDIVLSLDDMDEGTLEALLDGIAVIGVAGPALLTAGLAFRLIGYALTPAGAIGLGAIALGALAVSVQKLKEVDFADNFGNMQLDMVTLGGYVTTLGGDFSTAYAEINEFNTALSGSVTAYTEASEKFASNILTNMLTATTLTPEDKEALSGYGEAMFTSIMEGAAYATATSMSYWKMIFGGEDVAVENEAYQRFIALLELGFNDWEATAEGLQRDFTFKLNLAIDDDIIDPEEYAELMAQLDKINELEAQIADRQNYIERQKILKKAQTAGFDDIAAFAKMQQDQRDAELAAAQEYFDEQYYGLQYDYDMAIAEGRTLYDGRPATEENKAADLAEAQALYDRRVMESQENYDAGLMRLWEGALGQSDLAGVLQSAEDVTAQVMQGLLSPETAETLLREQYGINYLAGETGFGSDSTDRSQLGQALVRYIYSLGGYEALADKIAYYESIGDTQTTEQLRTLQIMEQIVNGFMRSGLMDADGGWMSIFNGKIIAGWESKLFDSMALPEYANDGGMDAESGRALLSSADDNQKLTAFWDVIGQFANEGGIGLTDIVVAMQNLQSGQEDVLDNIVTELANTYDFEAVLRDMGGADQYGDLGDVVAAYSLLYGTASQNTESYLINTAEPLVIPIEPDISEGAVQNEIDNSQLLLNQQPGYWTINPVLQNIDLGTPQLPGFPGYADGGRATEPSIFGEAGAEWAIPEEHSQRTADLLSAAAEASGFTWPELINRNGGLNDNPGRTPRQLIYSPTINVKDARGVAEVLAEDKERLDKWYEEKQLRDEVEVYQ